MTGRPAPTVVTSRRRQHELLRSWSGWPLTSILIDPTEVADVRESGWARTHHHDPETGLRIVGSADGLGFGADDGWHHPAEVVPWAEVESIGTAVPADVRQQLVEFRSRWRDHQRAYPRFVASADAVGCGPIVPGRPLTPRQEAYLREHEAFEASGVLPAWEQKRATLDEERLSLHAQALALEADSEAGDLLELLADQRVQHDAGKVTRPPAAAPTGFEIRACVEDEHGDVTSAEVSDAEAAFITLYEVDHDGLPQAIGDYPSREAAQHALEYPKDRTKQDVAVSTPETNGGQEPAGTPSLDGVTDDQVREHVSELPKGKPVRIDGMRIQKTGTYGRDRRPVFLIGDPIAGARTRA